LLFLGSFSPSYFAGFWMEKKRGMALLFKTVSGQKMFLIPKVKKKY